MPPDVTQLLSGILQAPIKSGALQEKVRGNAAEMEFAGTGPDEFRALVVSEFGLWQRVIQATTIERQ